MHPAASVILFTTASGAGYGLLAWICAFALAGAAPRSPAFGLAGLGLAFALITLGLLSSTFHLGRPERAWRALSQWRTSWLAREGVAAVATYLAAAPFALGWVFWGRFDGGFALAAALSLALSVATVVCTGMIYASLKPIRQWRNVWTTPVYLALAAASGALLWVDLTLAFGAFHSNSAALALAGLAAAGAAKFAYWRAVDAQPPTSTLASATGLARFGEVKLLELPHTEENYVMREMGYRVARKHAAKLRRFAALALFVVPAALTALLALTGSPWLAGAATLSAAAGLSVERWLFFAQATHASMLYYGRAP